MHVRESKAAVRRRTDLLLVSLLDVLQLPQKLLRLFLTKRLGSS